MVTSAVTFARRVELPTWLVAAAVYGGWLVVTYFASVLPWWTVLPIGGYLVAWHGSLQHETIHGHPTRNARVNAAIAAPPLSLWLPFPIYRESHLIHHKTPELTCPIRDPESLYVDHAQWRHLGPGRRALWWIERRLIGRMLIGPLTTSLRFWSSEGARLRRGDNRHVGAWLIHLAMVAALLLWVTQVCGLAVWQYIVLFAYPGFSLSLVRSFTEHRPGHTQAQRSAIVEAGFLGSLLYLNNNLHVLHHAAPEVPWYDLPRRFRRDRDKLVAANGHFVFRGYLEIVLRYGFVAKDEPIHPVRRELDQPGDDDGTTATSIA